MGFIGGLLLLFLLFLGLAPRFFRKLLLLDVIITVIGTIGITIYAVANGLTRLSGGSFEAGGVAILLMIYSIPVLMIFGIVVGLLSRLLLALFRKAAERQSHN